MFGILLTIASGAECGWVLAKSWLVDMLKSDEFAEESVALHAFACLSMLDRLVGGRKGFWWLRIMERVMFEGKMASVMKIVI